jgi:hypothetical protein
MKNILVLGILGILFGFKQINNPTLKTTKYAGIYSFGDNVEKGSVGSVTVFPETDSTVLFYVDVCRGAPSYNLGQLYDRLKIKSDSGIYYSKMYDEKNACKWKVTIDKKLLIISTLDNSYECGFGHAVNADHHYKLKKRFTPEYFTDGHGHKVYFKKTSPESYLK